MRLRTKVAIVFVLSMLVLAGITFGSIEFFKQQAVSETQGEVDQSAQLTAQELEGSLTELTSTLRLYAGRDGNLSSANRTASQLVDGTDFFAGQVLAANGSIVAYRDQFASTSAEQAFVGLDRGSESYIQTALAGDTAFRKPEATDDGEFLLWVAHPIRDVEETERVTGVLTGVITLERSELFSFQADDPVDHGQAVTVRGETKSGSEVVFYGQPEPFTDSLQRSALVTDTGWVVTVSRDRGPLADRLRILRYLQGGGLFLVIVVFGGIGYWEYRTNLTQTTRLLAGFEALTDGEYDHELSLSAAEEWRQIGDGFNEMADGIEQREQTIQEREQVLSVLTRLLRHNVQNDLAVARGHVEMLPELAEERQDESVAVALSATEKLLGHAAKAKQLDAAMKSAEDGVRKMDISATVADECRQFERSYPEAEILVDGPTTCSVWGIEPFSYAIETLVENALEHTDSDSPLVEITITENEDRVLLTISDDGPGIPEHEQEVLTHREETDLEHGSGVGLWLAHIVVEKSGGSLQFGDQSDGGAVRIELCSAAVEKEDVETTLGTLD